MAPETMREIGRLREEAFRFYGGGTGRDCDVDEFDLADDGYRQLIVWIPLKELSSVATASCSATRYRWTK